MAIYLRGKSYYFDFVHKGQRYTGCIGPVSRTVAKEEEARKKAEVIEGRLNPARARKSPRFDAFAEEYLGWSKANKKPRAHERDVTSLAALRPFFSGKTLADITPWPIEKYKKARKDLGKSNQTVNLELACLKALFSKAIIWRKAGENPVKQVKMLQVNNARVRFLEEEEEARLLPECKGYLHDIVCTALNTGFRRNELLSLRPEEVDFTRGLVNVRAGYAKNGEGRSVPMTGILREVLRRLVKEAQESGSLHLFRNQHGAPLRIYALRDAFENAVQEAGLRDFHFHDLRHTFASRLVMAGVDIRTVQELMGHKTIAMTLRYAHLSPDHKRKAMEALESRFSAKSPINFHNTPAFAPLSDTKKAV
jgi:integrase